MALATEEPLADLINSTLKKRLKASLHEVFGIDSLRPGQEAVIRNVLRRADTLAIMPTGAGKSLCYQLPALYLGGRYPSVDQVLRIAAAVRRLAAENDGQAIEQPVEALHEWLPDIGTNKLRTALSLMREIAMVRRTRRGAVKPQACNSDQHADERLREAAQRYTAMAENDRDILERMIGYAQSAQCRWRIVLDYFTTQMVSIGTSRAAPSECGHGNAGASIGDELDGGVCGNCDNCLAPPTITPGPREMHEAQYDTQNAQSAARQAKTWQVGDDVRVRAHAPHRLRLARDALPAHGV